MTIDLSCSIHGAPVTKGKKIFIFVSAKLCLQMLFLFWQQMKFKSQLEQQRLQLQREHSSEMEQILDKVSNSFSSLLEKN